MMCLYTVCDKWNGVDGFSFQPGRKTKFIDKKSSVTFHLVHRSQRDPLQADDEAPQHVLMPLQTSNENVSTMFIHFKLNRAIS